MKRPPKKNSIKSMLAGTAPHQPAAEKNLDKLSKIKPTLSVFFESIQTTSTQLGQSLLRSLSGQSNRWLKAVDQKKNHSEKAFKNHVAGTQKVVTKPSTGFGSRIPKPLKFVLKGLLFPFLNPFARVATVLVIIGAGVGVAYLLKDLPSPRKLTSSENFAVSTQIFDRNGELLYEIFGDEHRIPVALADLPPYVSQSSIAIEDQRFYSHFGIDVLGVIRALNNNLRGQPIEGGSTITQQLVKNALLTREQTLQRKVKEALLAIITEVIYSKEEILEMYLNYISYGGTAVGIEAASQQYFNKHAKDLTLAEATLLAGLPQAPSYFSPFQSDQTRSKDRQAEVLRRMVEDRYITALEAEDAKSQTLKFAISKTDIKAPHFVFYVRDLLYNQFGEELVEKGGLRVYTTLDLQLQETVQASVSAEVAKLERLRVGNGAALVTKPNTGEILAMVGSQDYFDEEKDGQVNVTLALRQPGSSIKPLVYATAFQEKTLNPGSILLDVPTCFEIPGQKPYCPKNYDGTFKGPIEVRKSLGNSLNIPAVKAMKTIGVETFLTYAQSFGLKTLQDPSRYGLSLALGGGEVKMIDMAQAFGVLANEGVKVPLTPILRIEDYKGELIQDTDTNRRLKSLAVLTEFDGEEKEGGLTRVLDRAPAYLASHIMQDNSARELAFGPKSELVIPNQVVSAKTGTTNDLKDNWTVGFTPEFLVITWVGNNDGSPMNPYLVSGVTGAAPIWNDIMSVVLANKEPVWQEKPDDVSSAGVCSTGVPPQNGQTCKIRYNELFWKRSKPSESREYQQDVWIRPETGLPVPEGESIDGAVPQQRTLFTDPVTSTYCADCSRPVDDQGKTVYERIVVKETVQNNESTSNSQ